MARTKKVGMYQVTGDHTEMAFSRALHISDTRENELRKIMNTVEGKKMAFSKAVEIVSKEVVSANELAFVSFMLGRSVESTENVTSEGVKIVMESLEKGTRQYYRRRQLENLKTGLVIFLYALAASWALHTLLNIFLK